jgi:ABC-2 type transport system ATP-binding protein
MISITGLDFAYKKKKNLFTNLNLELQGGNIYGLLGKNGVGKTTLLKIISGLLFPQKGECRVLGFEPKKRHPDMFSEIFIIAEELFVPQLSIKEFRDLYSPFYPRFKTNEFHNYMEEFSISEKEKLPRLSYGQKKKFLIAFGLSTDCRILILDEPTNGLDIPGKSQFRKYMASSINEERVFIISTHQVRDMQQLIDPVIILDNGEKIFQRSVTEINESLGVRFVKDEPDPDKTLFYEKVIGGYSSLAADDVNGSADIDLELLFNAVIKNGKKINEVFREKKDENE